MHVDAVLLRYILLHLPRTVSLWDQLKMSYVAQLYISNSQFNGDAPMYFVWSDTDSYFVLWLFITQFRRAADDMSFHFWLATEHFLEWVPYCFLSMIEEQLVFFWFDGSK
jgi:hypothetical protein